MRDEESIRERVARVGFAGLGLGAAIIVGLGTFVGLPSRWPVIDVPAAILVALHTASGVGLLTRASWMERAARLAGIVSLAIGLVLSALVVMSMSYLSGIYGAVGRGGALIFFLVISLLFPYLVVFPTAQLLWIGSPKRGRRHGEMHEHRAGGDGGGGGRGGGGGGGGGRGGGGGGGGGGGRGGGRGRRDEEAAPGQSDASQALG